ncbi:MAG: hypothetical protein ACE5GE_09510, partial [Phycisphaerae bacterium]
VNNACVFTPIPTCCNVNGDCTDTDVCTTDTCVNNACVFTPIPTCCNTNGDCTDTDVCTTDTCVNNACVFTPIPNCCNTNGDCTDTDVCTTDTCVNNACVFTPIPTCCNTNGDCTDTDVCTTDACVNNACVFTPIANCCVTTADCAALEVCDQVNNVCLPDCNTNGIADGLEGCLLLGARSCQAHAPGGRLCLDLLAGSQIEPRLDGPDDIEIDLDSGCLAGAVSVSCDNGIAVTDESARILSVTVNGNTVNVTFSPALPDESACVISLSCGASVCVRGLRGDVDRNGSVTTGDASQVRFFFNQSASTAGPQWDMDQINGITTGDFSQIRFFFNNTAPVCP